MPFTPLNIPGPIAPLGPFPSVENPNTIPNCVVTGYADLAALTAGVPDYCRTQPGALAYTLDGRWYILVDTAGSGTWQELPLPIPGSTDRAIAATTSDATPTTVLTVALAPDTSLSIGLLLNVSGAGADQNALLIGWDSFRRPGTGAPVRTQGSGITKTVQLRDTTLAAYDYATAISGNNVIVVVTGIAATDLSVVGFATLVAQVVP